MASPLNVDLDFLDYSPASGQDETHGSTTDPSQQQDRPGVQIRIPESAVSQQATTNQQSPPSTTGNLFQNLLNNAASLGSQSGMSDEALRQIMWAANRQRQGQQKANKSSGNFNWALNYLSQYFDVTTTDVVERILWSAIPLRKTGVDIDTLDEEVMAPLASESPTNDTEGSAHLSPSHRPYSHMERFIQSRPDLYGPFWVSATLVFLIGIFSNIASYVNHHTRLTKSVLAVDVHVDLNKSAEVYSNQIGTELDSWHYSMDELNTSSSLVMVYVILMPTVVWFCFWFRGCSRLYTLTEIVCAYGYSLSIFIPLAMMLTIQNILFRYFMITLAAALSGTVLMLSFLPVVKSDPNPASSHIILVVVPLCQFGLAYIIHRVMLQ